VNEDRSAFTAADLLLELKEAARRLSEEGPRVTAAQVESALLRELRLKRRNELLTSAWTADIIIHHILHVDFGASER